VHETTTFLLVTLPNTQRLKYFTDKLSNEPFLLTSTLHVKCVATLCCNLLLIACFLTLRFHKVVWQHVQGMAGFKKNVYCKFTKESDSERILKIG